jgi:hypothetical protein
MSVLESIHEVLLLIMWITFLSFVFQVVQLAATVGTPKRKKIVKVTDEKTGKVEKREITKPEW